MRDLDDLSREWEEISVDRRSLVFELSMILLVVVLVSSLKSPRLQLGTVVVGSLILLFSPSEVLQRPDLAVVDVYEEDEIWVVSDDSEKTFSSRDELWKTSVEEGFLLRWRQKSAELRRRNRRRDILVGSLLVTSIGLVLLRYDRLFIVFGILTSVVWVYLSLRSYHWGAFSRRHY